MTGKTATVVRVAAPSRDHEAYIGAEGDIITVIPETDRYEGVYSLRFPDGVELDFKESELDIGVLFERAAEIMKNPLYLDTYDICLPDSREVLASVQANDATAAYDAYVEQAFGNGCCGFDVDVYCHSSGVVVEF